MKELWTDYPTRELSGIVKFYILGQLSFWVQQILVIYIEERRKDHMQMLSHHVVTIGLIATCYAYHFTRVGNLILITMDIVDILFPVSLGNHFSLQLLTFELSSPSASSTLILQLSATLHLACLS